MGKIAVTLVLLLVAVQGLAAPIIFVERPTFEFGTITQGQKVDHVFMIKNRGDESLVLKEIRSSCGCTAATPSTKTIAPGKSGEIRVSFDSGSFSGVVTKAVTVDSNDPRNPISSLVMKGMITEIISFTPRTINLGMLKPGTKVETSVILENRSGKTVSVLSVSSPVAGITGSAKTVATPPGKTCEVAVTVTVPKAGRFLSGYITIHTDHPQKRELVVPVYATISQ